MVNPVRDVRLFDNGFCEFFSKTPWYAIPLAYFPLIIYHLSLNGLGWELTIPLFLAGIFSWTWVEYMLHRFVFHGEDYESFPKNRLIYVLHFCIHGIHHCFPMDRFRLVFPPLPGYGVYYFLLRPAYENLIPAVYFNAFFAGGLVGYVLYDVTHYFLHHSTPKDGYVRNLKIYHM